MVMIDLTKCVNGIWTKKSWPLKKVKSFFNSIHPWTIFKNRLNWVGLTKFSFKRTPKISCWILMLWVFSSLHTCRLHSKCSLSSPYRKLWKIEENVFKEVNKSVGQWYQPVLHVPTVLQHIHFNENANLDREVKRKIIAEIVGILKSMKTQEAIRKIRKEHPEMNKSQVEKISDYSINTIRRYWEKDIIHFEEELTRINLKYI